MSKGQPIDWESERIKEIKQIYISPALSKDEIKASLRSMHEKYDRYISLLADTGGVRSVSDSSSVPEGLILDRDQQIIKILKDTIMYPQQIDAEVRRVDSEHERNMEKWRRTQLDSNGDLPIIDRGSQARARNTYEADVRSAIEDKILANKTLEAFQVGIDKPQLQSSNYSEEFRALLGDNSLLNQLTEDATSAELELEAAQEKYRRFPQEEESILTVDKEMDEVNQVQPSSSGGVPNSARVVVRASTVQNDLPTVGAPLKVNIETALTLLEPYTEMVRQNNQLRADDPDAHDKLLDTLQRISVDLAYLYNAIPANYQSITIEQAEAVATYFDKYKNGAMTGLDKIFGPETFGDSTVKIAVFGACYAIGSFFGQPLWGAGVGTALIAGKPEDFMKKHIKPKIDSVDTPEQ